MKRLHVLPLMIAAYLALDGSALRAANDPRASQLTYEPWMKACIGATCFVAAGARGACNPSGGVISIVTNEKTVSLSVTLGTKRTIEGVISAQIDQGEAILIPHPECNGLVCYGKMQIDGDFIERLKRSQTITIQATDVAHQKNSLVLSLAGFAGAYEGPASDPPKVHEKVLSPEKYKEMVQQEEERRKAFECKE